MQGTCVNNTYKVIDIKLIIFVWISKKSIRLYIPFKTDCCLVRTIIFMHFPCELKTKGPQKQSATHERKINLAFPDVCLEHLASKTMYSS